MTVEATLPSPTRWFRIGSRAAVVVAAALALWAAVDLAVFASLVRRSRALEPCPADVARGFHVRLFTNFEYWWGTPFCGIESGSFHDYAGPGGAFWRAGAGNFVLEFSHPMCS